MNLLKFRVLHWGCNSRVCDVLDSIPSPVLPKNSTNTHRPPAPPKHKQKKIPPTQILRNVNARLIFILNKEAVLYHKWGRIDLTQKIK